MSRIILFIFLPISFFLNSCAAIQGAHGDAASAKELSGAPSTAGANQSTQVNTSTVPSSPQQTQQQKATNNAARIIAPVL